MAKIDPDRQEAFLKALTALTRKYKIQIGACGCCNSPWLYEDETKRGGHYEVGDHGERLQFVFR